MAVPESHLRCCPGNENSASEPRFEFLVQQFDLQASPIELRYIDCLEKDRIQIIEKRSDGYRREFGELC